MNKRETTKRVLWQAFCVIFCACFLFTTAYAEGLTYSVQALLPQNQIDTEKTYFDLRMTPGQAQELRIKVTNNGTEPITLDIAANSASTNSNGIIDYITPGIKDETLGIAFSEITEVYPKQVTLKAREAQFICIVVRMPEHTYDGIILGGIFIGEHIDPNRQGEGIEIINRFTYVVGVVLHETDAEVNPNFELSEIIPELVDSRKALTHCIRNTEPALAKEIDMEIQVFENNAPNPLLQTTQTGIEMAPNSLMPFPVFWDDMDLDPGEYRSHVTLAYGGKEWEFDMPFEVESAELTEITSQPHYNATPKTPRWVYVLIGLVCVLIVLLMVLLIVVLRARKQLEESPEEPLH